MHLKPLAIDLFCGKGGWAHGLIAAGFHVIGFDIENMGGYPGELVLQDVLSLHGSQFRDAALIVASPPCQGYSYRAMPWKRAKALPPPDNTLFEACFRIQRESGGVPMVVENVKGAQPWVGRAKAHYGSFYLWGDLESVGGAIVAGRISFASVLLRAERVHNVSGFNFEQTGKPDGSFQTAATKIPGQDWSRFAKTGEVSPHWREQAINGGKGTDGANTFRVDGRPSKHFTNPEERYDAIKGGNGSWFNVAHGKRIPGNTVGSPVRGGNEFITAGVKQHASGPEWFDTGIAKHSSRSAARKEASARIAMIPFDLAYYIGRVFHPGEQPAILSPSEDTHPTGILTDSS